MRCHDSPSFASLRPHQQRVVQDVLAVLAHEPRTTAVMACGTGKTRVGAETAGIVARQGTGRSLIVMPTLELISQTLREWAEHLTSAALGQVIAVCSDREVVSATRTGLALPGTVTSDPEHVAHALTRPGPTTVACTYQSLAVITEAQQHHGMGPVDIAIVDEAHRTAGLAGRPWAAIHDAQAVHARRRLYLTATPKIMETGREEEDRFLISMDAPAVYGPLAHRLSFGQAIELGLLAPYRVVVALITQDEVRPLLADDGPYLRTGNVAVAGKMLAAQLAVLRASHQHAVRKMITFHNTRTDAKWFAMTLPDAYNLLPPDSRPSSLRAEYLHGQHTIRHRHEILKMLADDTDGLCTVSNAKLLSEGVDIPAVDSVAILDPRGVISTVQAVGRALRRVPGRDKTASVIVPVILEPGEHPDEALHTSRFSVVWQTIRALAAHDDMLAAYLAAHRRPVHSSTARSTLSALPDWLTMTGLEVPPSFEHAIGVQAITMTAPPPTFDDYFRAAERYRTDHGDLLVPIRYMTPDGLRLGRWIGRLRERYGHGELTQDLIDQLKPLGMVWGVRESKHQLFMRQLRKYKDTHGHLLIPDNYTADGEAVGRKVARVRKRRSRISSDMRDELDAIGFIWCVKEYRRNQFIKGLTEYREKYGNLSFDSEYVMDLKGFSIKPKATLTMLRRDYHEGNLDASHYEKLKKLGVDFSPIKRRVYRSDEEPSKRMRRYQRTSARRAAEKRFPESARNELLKRLAHGESFQQACLALGVTRKSVYNWAMWDATWESVLDEALIAGRDRDLDHGTPDAYRTGCICPPCRTSRGTPRIPQPKTDHDSE